MMPTLKAAVLAFLLATAPQDDARTAKLIADLGDPDVTVREAATRSLVSLGSEAIPGLSAVLRSGDDEVRRRATRALGEIERNRVLATVIRARRPVTLALSGQPFARALQEIGQQTGLRFSGATDRTGPPLTISLAGVPVMQALDAVADAMGDVQWRFEDEDTVRWAPIPRVPRPSCYAPGFTVTLDRMDCFKSWDYQDYRAYLWVYLQAQAEPGIRPVGLPRFQLTEIRDARGNDLKSDADLEEGAVPEGMRNALRRPGRGVYESTPFVFSGVDRAAQRIAVLRGRVIFLFPAETKDLALDDLCEGATVAHGELSLQVNDVLNTSLQLTLTNTGCTSELAHHLDADSIVLIDAEGLEHRRGQDFEVQVNQMTPDSLRYSIEMAPDAHFDACSLRLKLIATFHEKAVPFEFRNVPLP